MWKQHKFFDVDAVQLSVMVHKPVSEFPKVDLCRLLTATMMRQDQMVF